MPPRHSPYWLDYELGIADKLRHTFADQAEVSSNVRVFGRSGRMRQIDVLVRWQLPGMGEITMVVDAKRYTVKVNIKHVETFAGLVDDVGAALGLMVAPSGFTPGAKDRATMVRGIRLEVVTLAELPQWNPPGMVEVMILLAASGTDGAIAALRQHRFRTKIRPHVTEDARVYLCVFRHYGTRQPSPDVQLAQITEVRAILDRTLIPYEYVGHGITCGGGTPAHEWIIVMPVRIAVLADNVAELEHQIVLLAERYGLPRELLYAEAPAMWAV